MVTRFVPSTSIAVRDGTLSVLLAQRAALVITTSIAARLWNLVAALLVIARKGRKARPVRRKREPAEMWSVNPVRFARCRPSAKGAKAARIIAASMQCVLLMTCVVRLGTPFAQRVQPGDPDGPDWTALQLPTRAKQRFVYRRFSFSKTEPKVLARSLG